MFSCAHKATTRSTPSASICSIGSIWRDARGSAGIEKILILACFVFAIVAGVRVLSGGTYEALVCQGANLLNPGSRMCGTGTDTPNGSVAVLNNVEDPKPTGGGRRCSGDMCMCFVAGTPVITKTGFLPIETLKPGDLVLSQGADGEPVWRPVLQTFVSRARSLVRLSLSDGRIHEVIETTGNHPFYVADRGWIEARDLDPERDHLLNDIGAPVDIIAAEHIPGRVQVYNLEVAGLHTYFVGEIGTWVHNAGGERVRIRGTRTQLTLGMPGNRVGRVVQIRVRVNNQNVYTQATVIGRNADGTYNVQWTDAQGQVRYNQINNIGQVQGPRVYGPGSVVDIDVAGNPAVVPQGTVVGQNANGTYNVTATNPAGVHHLTASVNAQGQLQLHPLPGERITATNMYGQQFDALVVNRMDDLSVEVELRDQTTDQRMSGLLVQVANGPPMLMDFPPPARPAAPPTTINGVPVQPPPAGILANGVTTVGNIEIHHGRAPPSFVANTLHDLNTIAQTPSGQRLLDSLQNGGGPNAQPVHIHYRPATHATNQDVAETILINSFEGFWHADRTEPGRGGGARVYYNPNMPLLPILPTGHTAQVGVDGQYLDDLRAGFGRAMNAPSDLVLFHELVHADDYRRGMGFPVGSTFGMTNELSEERTVGLGEFAPAALQHFPHYSENTYRADRNLPQRTFYGAPGERHSTRQIRGFMAQTFLRSHLPGGPFPTGQPHRVAPPPEDAQPAVATLSILTETEHNHINSALRTREVGHAWIAINLTAPNADLPTDLATRFAHHYQNLQNNRTNPLGYHLGFNPVVEGGFVGTYPGQVELETGRDLSRVTGYQTLDLNGDQLMNVLQYVDDNRNRNWNLADYNCVTFAMGAREAAGYGALDVAVHGRDMPNRLWELIRRMNRANMQGTAYTQLATQTHLNGVPLPRPRRRPQNQLLPNVPTVPNTPAPAPGPPPGTGGAPVNLPPQLAFAPLVVPGVATVPLPPVQAPPVPLPAHLTLPQIVPAAPLAPIPLPNITATAPNPAGPSTTTTTGNQGGPAGPSTINQGGPAGPSTNTNIGGASQGATRAPAINDLDPSPFATPNSPMCG